MGPLQIASESTIIFPEPFEQSKFAPFGNVVTSPLPPSQISFPDKINTSQDDSSTLSRPVIANQSTALKYAPIASFQNNYPSAPSKHIGRPLQSLFACFPRTLRDGKILDVQLLERHPYTTQTFAPLGLGEDSESVYLVVVVPSLQAPITGKSAEGKEAPIQCPPDLEKLRAFVAHGGQAVTYGVGTWHAPMIVLGKKRVDFLVTQFVSGVSDEDCQEVLLSKKLSVPIDYHLPSSSHQVRSNL